MATAMADSHRFAFGHDFIRVVLDPDCGTGHHVFADSATNGPRGTALVDEFIPYIESTFPALANPRSRLLNGHSSGGWSSLWLQVTYPDFFGGTWSTSPDPVDFRDFQRINIYASGENMFRDRDGKRRPIARIGSHARTFFRPVLQDGRRDRLGRASSARSRLSSARSIRKATRANSGIDPAAPSIPKSPRRGKPTTSASSSSETGRCSGPS